MPLPFKILAGCEQKYFAVGELAPRKAKAQKHPEVYCFEYFANKSLRIKILQVGKALMARQTI